MRILFVKLFCPNSIPFGSEMRSRRLIEFLRRKGEVDLLIFTKPTARGDQDYMKTKFKNVFEFYLTDTSTLPTFFERLIRLLPWQLIQFYSKETQQKVLDLVEKNQYDFIFIFKIEPALSFFQLFDKWKKKIVIDFDDILSDLCHTHYKNFFSAWRNKFLVRRYERKALQQFTQVFVCSRDAVNKISPLYRNKVGIIPNVFSTDESSFFSPSQQKNHLLFVRSLDYFLNTQGLKWFFNHIWPEVKKVFPDLRIKIIGKIIIETPGDKDLLYQTLGHPADVEIIINVPEVKSYYENCFASIVPLLDGSGTRLKILESAAFGRPVLSTPKGAEGLIFEDKKEIFIFKDSQSFIEAYQALLSEENYQKVTQRALGVLREHYSPAAFEASMERIWDRVINSF